MICDELQIVCIYIFIIITSYSNFDPQLGSCNSITLLSLSSNYLNYLPDEMGRISNLAVLNLSNNNLKYLPYSFTKLKKVQAMWLSDNQVSYIQSERSLTSSIVVANH